MGFPHSHPHFGHPALSGLPPPHPVYTYGPPVPGIPGVLPPSHPPILPPGKKNICIIILSLIILDHIFHQRILIL